MPKRNDVRKEKSIIRAQLTICLTTGSRTVQVAVFDVGSVMMPATNSRMRHINGAGRLALEPVNKLLIHTERPDFSHAFAIAKPPPSRRMTPHETRSCVVFQSSRGGDVDKCHGSFGIKKNRIQTNIAGT